MIVVVVLGKGRVDSRVAILGLVHVDGLDAIGLVRVGGEGEGFRQHAEGDRLAGGSGVTHSVRLGQTRPRTRRLPFRLGVLATPLAQADVSPLPPARLPATWLRLIAALRLFRPRALAAASCEPAPVEW